MVRKIADRLDQRIIVDQYQGFQRISSVVQIIPAVANRLSGRSIDPPLDTLVHCPLCCACLYKLRVFGNSKGKMSYSKRPVGHIYCNYCTLG